METVGVRELKSELSRYLRRVRAGARLTVTERGKAIATLAPVNTPTSLQWAQTLVVDGRAQWAGGKPAGVTRRASTTSGPSVSAAVLEDRG